MVTINGGIIDAQGGENGAGIGGSLSSEFDRVYITGGQVTAKGGTFGAGIGHGFYGKYANVYISGGTVTAYGGTQSAGIGGGYDSYGATVYVTDGTIYAYGGTDCPGIGDGYSADSTGSYRMVGGNVTVYTVASSTQAEGNTYQESGSISFSGGIPSVTGSVSNLKAGYPVETDMTYVQYIGDSFVDSQADHSFTVKAMGKMNGRQFM